MRIFENTNFALVQNRTRAYLISGTLLLLSMIGFVTRGLEVGIDFTGGMEFVLQADQPLAVPTVRNTLSNVLSAEPEVKTFGNERTILVRTQAQGEITEMQAIVLGGVQSAFPDATIEVVNTNIVGPSFAQDMKVNALYAVLGALLVIFAYIMIRFEWRYGLGAVAALFHDVVVTLGLFSLLHHLVPFSLAIDQTIIAALLTIVGYSINDTVVVFDRIREYRNLFKTEALESVVNRSINNTLSRTFMTSFTTLLVVVALFILGGEVLRGFAFALIVGIVIGTYSSVFVASPVVVELAARSKAARR